MKLVESILTRNPCYTAGRKITVKGLMLHSVGCPQPKASVFISSWNSPSHDTSCVHGFIDGNDGTVYQTLPWNHRGWHCGSGSKGSGNNTHIGVEMCEPTCIRYTAGSNFTCSNLAEARSVAERTYGAAVELFAMLCRKYSLDPLADGVIISHREGHGRGIASNHGDPEHLWTQLGMGYTMDSFRKAVRAAMDKDGTDGYTEIMGKAVATADQMKSYIRGKNPSVEPSVLDMIPLYLSEGEAEGVRGDIAFAQSCLETGNFAYSGSAVTLSQNNFCGLGVTQRAKKGLSFETPQFGIRAQVQHLKAYASEDALKNGCIDPRFRYVTRGCAPYVEWLGQKENPQGKGWAAGERYGEKILSILKAVMDEGKVQFMESLTLSAPYMVRVAIPDLNIRRGPGTGYAKTGKYTGIGNFTIVEEADGKGASKWGLLKAYQDKRDGWISLDHAVRV
ncbi:N-acetylmuramoyl-L-alanine amidase [Parablautia muri]|uniref:N-acetylmuramoyl-L-alanine amidase n=1 Tax=Parablautia muri TaxID=2320879 RepID=A0A9X5GT09_9FIRM|nr:N-acetylmuramoyl-L-alanine amidase [Parablautia muri]NBJ93536.1 N-acetylmuramoyl-L-alanine amidase [Parablautia muri]